jgi:hypothetical protein
LVLGGILGAVFDAFSSVKHHSSAIMEEIPVRFATYVAFCPAVRLDHRV